MPRSVAGASSLAARQARHQPHLPSGQPSQEELTLYTTLSAYADALDALPLDLTRSFSDLRELDAVLGAHLNSLTNRLIHLAALIEDPNVSPGERIVALKEVAEEARSYKMGGEDKIRVALNTAETVSVIISHTTYIDTLLANFASVPSLAQLLNPPVQSHIAGHLSDGTPLAPGSGPGGNNPANLTAFTEIITPNTKRKRPIGGSGQNANNLIGSVAGPSGGVNSGIDKSKGSEVNTHAQAAPPTVKKRKPPGQGAQVKAKNQANNANATMAISSFAAVDDGEDKKSAVKKRATKDDEDGGDQAGNGRARPARSRGTNVRGSGSDEEEEDSEGDSNAGGASSRPARVARAPRPVHDAEAATLVPHTTIGEDADERRYCFCNNVSYGDMIGCDDDDCEREWFHLGCVGLLKPPQGTWYCDDCAQKRAVRNNKSKKSKGGKAGGAAGLTSVDNKARVMQNSKR